MQDAVQIVCKRIAAPQAAKRQQRALELVSDICALCAAQLAPYSPLLGGAVQAIADAPGNGARSLRKSVAQDAAALATKLHGTKDASSSSIKETEAGVCTAAVPDEGVAPPADAPHKSDTVRCFKASSSACLQQLGPQCS